MTATTVANIARPISSAISTAFQSTDYGYMDAYGKLGAWSPLSLFANSEVGAWYDPSDLTTMFQDSEGTTPVTADGQPVGLILDKSKGLALGSELVPDSSFDNPVAWNPQNSNWVVSGGKATYTDAGLSYLESVGNISFVQDQWYRLSFTISGATGVAVQVVFGLFNKTASVNLLGAYLDFTSTDAIPVNGPHTIYFKSPATTTGIRIYGNDSGNSPTWSLESFNIVAVAGNHASQATAAARPLYKTSGLAKYNDYDAVDDVLNSTFPSSLGSSCTVAKAVVGAAPTILTGQTIGTTWAESTDNAGVVIVNRALTTQETTDLTAWLLDKGKTA